MIDIYTKITELKAKRRAVEQAIAALQNLKSEYQDRRIANMIPGRRSGATHKPASPRKIA